MNRPRPRARRGVVALLLTLALAATLVAGTAAAPNKPVLADISPVTSDIFSIVADDVAVGTCVQFRFSLQNNTKTQQMGSANVTLDTELVYGTTDCGLELGGPTTGIAPKGLPDDPVIELRDLNAAPGAIVSFTFQALVPCSPTDYAYDGFSVIAKQANNYSGDPGNDLTIADASDFDVQAVGFCETFDGTTKGKGSINGTTSGTTYTAETVIPAAGTLILAKGVNDIDCTDLGYPPHTDTVTVNFTGNAEKILTFQFPNTTKEPKSAFRVCFAAGEGSEPWADRDGLPLVDPGVPSLLADCNDNTAPTNLPCMLPVEIKNRIVTIKAWLREGDPPGRG